MHESLRGSAYKFGTCISSHFPVFCPYQKYLRTVSRKNVLCTKSHPSGLNMKHWNVHDSALSWLGLSMSNHAMFKLQIDSYSWTICECVDSETNDVMPIDVATKTVPTDFPIGFFFRFGNEQLLHVQYIEAILTKHKCTDSKFGAFFFLFFVVVSVKNDMLNSEQKLCWCFGNSSDPR